MTIRLTRSHKFNARSITIDGHYFPSLAEGNRYQELKLLESQGEISDLQLQPKFMLQRAFIDAKGQKHQPIYYKADFKYIENGIEVVEDIKGMETELFKVKAKLFLFQYRQYDYRIIEV